MFLHRSARDCFISNLLRSKFLNPKTTEAGLAYDNTKTIETRLVYNKQRNICVNFLAQKQQKLDWLITNKEYLHKDSP